MSDDLRERLDGEWTGDLRDEIRDELDRLWAENAELRAMFVGSAGTVGAVADALAEPDLRETPEAIPARVAALRSQLDSVRRWRGLYLWPAADPRRPGYMDELDAILDAPAGVQPTPEPTTREHDHTVRGER